MLLDSDYDALNTYSKRFIAINAISELMATGIWAAVIMASATIIAALMGLFNGPTSTSEGINLVNTTIKNQNDSTNVFSYNGNVTVITDPKRSKDVIAANPNHLPKLYDLRPDKESPQIEGVTVTWTVDALDDDSDPIFYRFFLNGKIKRDWLKDNRWTWKTVEDDVDENNQIEVWIAMENTLELTDTTITTFIHHLSLLILRYKALSYHLQLAQIRSNLTMVVILATLVAVRLSNLLKITLLIRRPSYQNLERRSYKNRSMFRMLKLTMILY